MRNPEFEPGPTGDRNVVIRPGGPGGDIRIGGGVAIGHGAQADETSVAIGGGAGAGRRTAMVPVSVIDDWSTWLLTLVTAALAAVVAGVVLALLQV